eukprot:9851257-Lingulodinium_polyedra.AAC.1
MAERGFTPCNARPDVVAPWVPTSRQDLPPAGTYTKTDDVAKGWAHIDREFQACFIANTTNFRSLCPLGAEA